MENQIRTFHTPRRYTTKSNLTQTTSARRQPNAKVTGQSSAMQRYHSNGKAQQRSSKRTTTRSTTPRTPRRTPSKRPTTRQPTPQQIAEHNLTHLPQRSWCPICVQGKGRQDNYKQHQSRHSILQVDFAYIKSQQDLKTMPVLTAVDVELCMAVLVPDKPSMMDYITNSLQAFIFECGRTQGMLQGDNKDTLNALLK